MPHVQVRDVPESTVAALKAQAAAQGLTLSALLRSELERIANRPEPSGRIERLAHRSRRGGPTTAQNLAELRRVRSES